ncbi:MAG: 4'-phosphopantetheinyl transferase superfamily protein [Planctomycetota bacterium]
MDEVALHASFHLTKAASVPLGTREVHVWAMPLQGDPAPFAALLSPAELHRLERFRFADHRRRYQIGHGALRLILGGYLDQDPGDIEFRHGPRGKPYLAEKGPYFNLSHSGKLALIAFAGTELGLDVEKVRHLESLGEIARRHFSESEFQALSALDGEQKQAAFYRCWTRKEAYIKAVGEGLSMPLDTFDVSVGEVPEFLACRDGREDPKNWSFLDVSPGPEFIAALALRALDQKVSTFRLEMG